MERGTLSVFMAVAVLMAAGCQKQESSEIHDTAVIYTELPAQPAEGGTDCITIFATCPWTLQGETWFTIDPATGDKGISESTITFAANTTGSARTGIVQIRAGDYSSTYTVTQKAE